MVKYNDHDNRLPFTITSIHHLPHSCRMSCLAYYWCHSKADLPPPFSILHQAWQDVRQWQILQLALDYNQSEHGEILTVVLSASNFSITSMSISFCSGSKLHTKHNIHRYIIQKITCT